MKIMINFDPKTKQANVLVQEDKKDTMSFYDAFPYCIDALSDFFKTMAKADMLRGYEYLEDEPLEDEYDEYYEELDNLEEIEESRPKQIAKQIVKGRGK